MVAHIVADKGFFYGEIVERRQLSSAVKAVYFRRFRKPRQLAFGIGLKIFAGACDIQRARRYAREHMVLVDGQLSLIVAVFV